MKPSSKESADRYDAAARILGEERVEQVSSIFGSERFSIATLKNIIKKQKIIASIREGAPCRKIVSQVKASRATIYRYYRYMNNGSKKKSHFDRN